MNDPREDKLPKWAQDLILSLRLEAHRKNRELDIANRQAKQDGASGLVIADCLIGEGFPLNDRAVVQFKLPGGKATVMLRNGGTILDINCDGKMMILPRASNSAYIIIDKL